MGQFVLHEYAPSGNCYKIRLTAAHLGLPLERRGYNILAGQTRTPHFLHTVNPNGRIPVLQVGNRFLPESNAACFFLAEGSDLMPRDAFERADMLRWMFFEQYSHEPNVATLRFWRSVIGESKLSAEQRAMIPSKQIAGTEAMDQLDRHLNGREWLADHRFTLADICLFAYSHVAGEGGFDLGSWPAIRAWIDRIEALPNHIAIDD